MTWVQESHTCIRRLVVLRWNPTEVMGNIKLILEMRNILCRVEAFSHSPLLRHSVVDPGPAAISLTQPDPVHQVPLFTQKVLKDRAQPHQWIQTSGQETRSDVPEPPGFWSQPGILPWRGSMSGSGSSSSARSTGSNRTHQKTASPRHNESSLEGERRYGRRRRYGRAFKKTQSTISDYFFFNSPCFYRVILKKNNNFTLNLNI